MHIHQFWLDIFIFRIMLMSTPLLRSPKWAQDKISIFVGGFPWTLWNVNKLRGKIELFLQMRMYNLLSNCCWKKRICGAIVPRDRWIQMPYNQIVQWTIKCGQTENRQSRQAIKINIYLSESKTLQIVTETRFEFYFSSHVLLCSQIGSNIYMNENNFIHCHKLCRNVKVHRNVDRDPVLEVLLFFPLVSRLISFLFTFWHLKVKWKFSISIFCIGTAPFLILSPSQILRRPVMSPIILNFLEYFDGNNPRLSCILERKPHENKYRTFEEKNIHFRNAFTWWSCERTQSQNLTSEDLQGILFISQIIDKNV